VQTDLYLGISSKMPWYSLTQDQPGSIVHEHEQPSPATVLPSSHYSKLSVSSMPILRSVPRNIPSPQFLEQAPRGGQLHPQLTVVTDLSSVKHIVATSHDTTLDEGVLSRILASPSELGSQAVILATCNSITELCVDYEARAQSFLLINGIISTHFFASCFCATERSKTYLKSAIIIASISCS
jgi:hypothetical protein